MKTLTKTFEVYSFDELDEKSQTKVINDTIQCFLETDYDLLSPSMQKAIDKAERMQTPWFVGNYMWEYAQDEVMVSINDFVYLKNGEIFYEN